MKKKILISVLAIIAIGLTIYFYKMPDNKIKTVRIGVLSPIIPSLPHWVAMDNGYYEELGLKVIENSQRSSKVLVDFLKNNDLDFLTGVSTTDVINAFVDKNQRLKAKIISHAQIKENEPFEGLLVPRGSLISNIKQLEDKKIAVYPGITAEATLKEFLSKHNVNISNIKFIKLPPPLHLKALRTGEVDCSFTYEPMRTFFLEGEKTREIYSSIYASFYNPSAIGVTVISQKLINEKPDIAKKIITVWNKSIDFINEHPKEARNILKKHLQLNDYTAQKSSWVYLTKTDEIDEEILRNTIKVYQNIGLISKDFKFNKSILYSEND